MNPLNLQNLIPNLLINQFNQMKSSKTVSIGDSMEDFMMVQKSQGYGTKTIFCGNYGTSDDPEKKL